MVAKFWHNNRHVGCSGIVYVTKQEKQATRKSFRRALEMAANIWHMKRHAGCSSHIYITKGDRTPRISGRQALAMVAKFWHNNRHVGCSNLCRHKTDSAREVTGWWKCVWVGIVGACGGDDVESCIDKHSVGTSASTCLERCRTEVKGS